MSYNITYTNIEERYAVTTNTINFRRGFTGHEHWNELGLIDMNGRFYDPLLARFLSPDPYVQAPDNSQNFNRYSYCLNNPLKYTDPSGEIVTEAVIVGTLLGAISGMMAGEMNNAHGWKMFGYVGVGALAGALGACAGQAINGCFTASSFYSGASTGAIGGAVGGTISGAGNAWLDGASFGKGVWSGFVYGNIGAFVGGVVGGVIGGIDALKDGRNFGNGASHIKEETLVNQDLPIVQQVGDYNCGPATAESTTGVDQDTYRKLVGGNPNKDAVKVEDLNKAIKIETGRNAKPYIKYLPTDEKGVRDLATLMQNGDNFYVSTNTITSSGDVIGHATALKSITLDTFKRPSGSLIYKTIYRVMDPAQGVVRTINANSVNCVVRIPHL